MARCLVLVCLLLGSGCGGRGVDCARLCTKAATCRAEIGQSLMEELPHRSPAMRHARRELEARLLDQVLASCPERCQVLTRTKRWREALKGCRMEEPCSRFAPCIVRMLSP